MNAPIGSEDWAKRWRLEVQFIWDNVPKQAQRLARFWVIGEEHQIWHLLNRSDGTTFSSFEEFCAAKEPWGLGAPIETVRRWLSMAQPRASRVEEVLRLVAVMTSQECENSLDNSNSYQSRRRAGSLARAGALT